MLTQKICLVSLIAIVCTLASTAHAARRALSTAQKSELRAKIRNDAERALARRPVKVLQPSLRVVFQRENGKLEATAIVMGKLRPTAAVKRYSPSLRRGRYYAHYTIAGSERLTLTLRPSGWMKLF